jgi:hypothetical protein
MRIAHGHGTFLLFPPELHLGLLMFLNLTIGCIFAEMQVTFRRLRHSRVTQVG